MGAETKDGIDQQRQTKPLGRVGRTRKSCLEWAIPGSTLSSFITRTGVTKAGPGEKPENYVMEPADVAKVAVLRASLPPEMNLYEATILPNHARSFISRG